MDFIILSNNKVPKTVRTYIVVSNRFEMEISCKVVLPCAVDERGDNLTNMYGKQ